MMANALNDYELCAIGLLLDEDDMKKRKRRRFGIHNMLKKRKIEGEYWTLYKELVDDASKFHQYFRMNRMQFEALLTKITPLIKKCDTRFKEAITPREMLVTCLRYLATGDSFKTIAFSFRLGHSTVQSIVLDVCNAIITTMKTECIPAPTVQQWNRIAKDFWDMWHFPNCVGALDGKHVQILAPANSGSLYFNYKKTFSVVLMALVDAKYQFIAVDIGSYGKNSDGGIFQNCNLGKRLANGKLPLPEDKPLPEMETPVPYVILGDEAFPLKTYLMRPYPAAQMEDNLKQHFNYRLSRARRVVENAFGILAQRFRIYNRRIQLQPTNVDKVILTTCILHNYIGVDLSHSQREQESVTTNLSNLPRQGGNGPLRAFHVRDSFKKFFQTAAGTIDWYQ